MALIHENITKSIIGAAFEVYQILGYGFLEVELKRLVLSNQSVFDPS
jgi:hypothetical protein